MDSSQPAKPSLRREVDQLKRDVRYMERAPKILRTHIYMTPAGRFELKCPCGHRHKIEYSEFEKHIWCYKCEKDYFIPQLSHHSGIFSGPIPYEVSKILGMCYERIDIKTKQITRDPLSLPVKDRTPEVHAAYANTWVKNEELMEYDRSFREPKE